MNGLQRQNLSLDLYTFDEPLWTSLIAFQLTAPRFCTSLKRRFRTLMRGVKSLGSHRWSSGAGAGQRMGSWYRSVTRVDFSVFDVVIQGLEHKILVDPRCSEKHFRTVEISRRKTDRG